MNKVTVNIYGREYTLVSDKPKDFLLKIASFVDDEIKAVSELITSARKTDIMILACNNIAEKYFDALNQKSENPSQEKLNETIEMQNREIAALKLQIEQKDVKIQSLEMTDMSSESLKAQIEKIQSSYEEKLAISNKKQKELQSLNDDIQNQFYNLQLKLAQTEEKLQTLQNQNGEKNE